MDELKRRLKEISIEHYNEITRQDNMHKVGLALQDILSEYGLGIALMVAYLHGLEVGHIPTRLNGANGKPVPKPYEMIHESGKDEFKFVRVAAREMRKNTNELKRRGIMNKKADPAEYIYHEDGLVGVFSFNLPQFNATAEAPLEKPDIVKILDHLHHIGILIPANVHNRQIQFKDAGAQETIARSGDRVYVRSEQPLPNASQPFLPQAYDTKTINQFILNSIRYKGPCNYCSIRTLNPLEATIHSTPRDIQREPEGKARSTVRNYQFGFTFAPFGDPETACHFLGWDFPHIHEQVMNMDPQWYSFADLITLVRVINLDIENFCQKNHIKDIPTVSGVCNHWAGNSIYHQHYQFFHLPELPVLSKKLGTRKVAGKEGVEVFRLEWGMPVYEIRASVRNREAAILAAESVARLWEQLNDEVGEEERYDLSYGNGIKIKQYTQNTFVTIEGEELRALFVPRHRSRLNAVYKLKDRNKELQKNNLGVLETLGYFIIDDKEEFDLLKELSPSERNACARSWLAQVTPPYDEAAFEARLQ
ncbi:MAG: hypothetical protein H6559_13050 [Lewinellaceae bacterium]|nr:hypothetical protein [Lewinellaceae bacterium]